MCKILMHSCCVVCVRVCVYVCTYVWKCQVLECVEERVHVFLPVQCGVPGASRSNETGRQRQIQYEHLGTEKEKVQTETDT